jgi:hypothetical protein
LQLITGAHVFESGTHVDNGCRDGQSLRERETEHRQTTIGSIRAVSARLPLPRLTQRPLSDRVAPQGTKTLSGVPSNFYFADISGATWDEKDGNAEVHVGRIPVYNNDVTTLDKIIDKIIVYESKPANAIAWRTHTLLCEKPFDNKTQGSALFEAMRTKYFDPMKWTYYRIYDDNNATPDESSSLTTPAQHP